MRRRLAEERIIGPVKGHESGVELMTVAADFRVTAPTPRARLSGVPGGHPILEGQANSPRPLKRDLSFVLKLIAKQLNVPGMQDARNFSGFIIVAPRAMIASRR